MSWREVAASMTCGILAGGAATRLDGRDKAWLMRDDAHGREPQVLRVARALSAQRPDGQVLVSANRTLSHYAAHGLRAVPDVHCGLGPLAGLHALASAVDSVWLLSVPVDVQHLPDDLLQRLGNAVTRSGATAAGTRLVDDDGPQPLVALWPVAALRPALDDAIASGALAVHALQARLGMTLLRWPGLRIGNLNTPADLAACGIRE